MKRRRELDQDIDKPATARKVNIFDCLDVRPYIRALQAHGQQLQARVSHLSPAAHHKPPQQQRQKQRLGTAAITVQHIQATQTVPQPVARPLHLLNGQEQSARATLDSPFVVVVCAERSTDTAVVKPASWVEPASPPAGTPAARHAATIELQTICDCSPSSGSDGYPVVRLEVETVDLTLESDSEGEAARDDPPAVQPAVVIQASKAAVAAAEAAAATLPTASSHSDTIETETEDEGGVVQSKESTASLTSANAVVFALQSPAGAAAASSADSETSGNSSASNDSCSNCGSSSGSDQEDEAEDESEVGSDTEWTPGKPGQTSSSSENSGRNSSRGRCRSPTDTAAKAAQVAAEPRLTADTAAATAQQLTPLAAVGLSKQQQQEETPVLTAQQRIRGTDCKSPGTPQILQLPCGLPGSSVLSAPVVQQQQVGKRDTSGRRVLAEVQLGQQRGLVTPPHKNSNKLSRQQQHSQKTVQNFLSMGKQSDANSLSALIPTPAAAPSTPEIVKHLQSTQQQQQDTVQGRDNQPSVASFNKPPVSLSAAVAVVASTNTTAPAVHAQGVMCGALRARAAAKAAAAAATAAATGAAGTTSNGAASSPPLTAVRGSQQQDTNLVSPLKQPAVPQTAATGAAAATSRALPAPPLLEFRTISYVRTPRQPGCGYGRIAGTAKKAREAAARAYHEAAAAAYSSGSNTDWSSRSGSPAASRNSHVNAFVTSGSCLTLPAEGGGSLSVKPTIEQRVTCAYMRMRLTEAAASGAAWAALDLAGLVLDTSHEALETCRQKYAAERGVLLKSRNQLQVAAEDNRMAAAFTWIKEIRLAAAAAAQDCKKQGILKRPVGDSSLPAWQVDGMVAVKQSVKFSTEVQVSTVPATSLPA